MTMNKLTYAEVTILSPKRRPFGMLIGSDVESGEELSSSFTPGNSVRSTNGIESSSSKVEETENVLINL